MATLPTKPGGATFLDIAKTLDPNGTTARTIELLAQTNDIIGDASVIEGNLPTGNRTTQRVGLPTIVFRRLYGGVPTGKSIRVQVDDSAGILEARSEVDKDLADLNGNASAFRLSEAGGFLEAMNQGATKALFYNDTVATPEGFLGFSPRYSSSSALNGQNVIKAGGATAANNHSLWLIGWAPDTVTLFYPKGTQAGLVHQDLGEIDAFDANNNRFRAYADLWKWKLGLALRDWRYAVRICNIDNTNLLTDTTGATYKLAELMIRAMNRIPSLSKCRPVFYCDRTLKEMLQIQAMNKSMNALGLAQGADQFTTNFLGIPIHTADQLLATEALVA